MKIVFHALDNARNEMFTLPAGRCAHDMSMTAKSATLDLSDSLVPLIDISGALAGEPSERSTVASQIDQACRLSGFFCVSGHGVDPELVDGLVATSKEFFDQPDEQKARYASPTGNAFRGWSDRRIEGPAGAVRAREHVEMSRFDSADELAAAGYSQEWIERAEPNVWPLTPPGFEAAWKAYFRAMDALGLQVLSLMAEALGLPSDWFDDKFDRQSSYLACNHYPATGDRVEPGTVRFDRHTDIGSLTLLYQDDGPGALQVLDRTDRWCDVPFRPGTYIVNLGDLMAKWTNDRWVATPHQVLAPPASETRARFSVPYFQHPNYDALIECIPSCLEEGQTPRYPAVVAGDWATYRFETYYD